MRNITAQTVGLRTEGGVCLCSNKHFVIVRGTLADREQKIPAYYYGVGAFRKLHLLG
jgi:hypothetical protein